MATRRGNERVTNALPLAYFAAALLLVVATLPTILRPPQQPPTQTAELSPDAPPDPDQQSIISSLNRSTSGVVGAGIEVADGGATTTTLAPKAVARACVRGFGNPLRQTADPQSLPCAGVFEGNNGGATHQGVTATEIRVAVPQWSDESTPLWERYFNDNYQFYGRQLRLLKAPDDGGGGQTARAALVDEQLQAFASTHENTSGGAEYAIELARRGVIVTTDRSQFSNDFMRERRPYMWQYSMAADDLMAQIGDWACARLVDRPARHAGAATGIPMNGQVRKFGLIANVEQGGSPFDPAPLEQSLRACGGELAVRTDVAQANIDPVASSTAISRMLQNGVTSIFCLCHAAFWGDVGRAAEAQGYFPEWLLSNIILNDHSPVVKLFGPGAEQRVHAFGITGFNRQLRVDEDWAWRSRREIAPNCCGSDVALLASYHLFTYRELMLLATGIQAAGPKLTPETFEQGLRRIRFANPPDPAHPPRMDLSRPDNFGVVTDTAEWFWSESAPAAYPDEVPGGLCYVDGGRRRARGGYSARESDEVFFTGRCG